jgi:cysteine-rich repeat protein
VYLLTKSCLFSLIVFWQCFSGYMLKEGKCVGDCGDGAISNGETCDDGNAESGDGCNSTCHIECGWECEIDADSEERVCQHECGDGVMAVGPESCDDGNTEDGDGKFTSACLCFVLCIHCHMCVSDVTSFVITGPDICTRGTQ